MIMYANIVPVSSKAKENNDENSDPVKLSTESQTLYVLSHLQILPASVLLLFVKPGAQVEARNESAFGRC